MFNCRTATTLWHQKVHNLVHNSTSYVPILCHTNPIHTLSFRSTSIYTHIYVKALQVYIFLQVSPPKFGMHISSTLSQMSLPSPNLLDVITLKIITGEQYRSRNSLFAAVSSFCNFVRLISK